MTYIAEQHIKKIQLSLNSLIQESNLGECNTPPA